MKFEEKTLKSETVYNGRVFTVNKDEIEISDGSKSFREVVLHSGGVVIVAKTDTGKVLLVKQYRYPIKQAVFELPAGKLEFGENPDLASKRELEEETGYNAKHWESLGYINTTPGFCDEKLYLYFAKELDYVGEHPDEGEIIQCYEYDVDEVLEMLNDGTINDAKTICAIFRALYKGYLKS